MKKMTLRTKTRLWVTGLLPVMLILTANIMHQAWTWWFWLLGRIG